MSKADFEVILALFLAHLWLVSWEPSFFARKVSRLLACQNLFERQRGDIEGCARNSEGSSERTWPWCFHKQVCCGGSQRTLRTLACGDCQSQVGVLSSVPAFWPFNLPSTFAWPRQMVPEPLLDPGSWLQGFCLARANGSGLTAKTHFELIFGSFSARRCDGQNPF